MIDTKAQLISQILKLNKPFKPRHVWEPLGLTPQLCNNYLSRFIEKGILTKQNSIYSVVNRELLIEELVEPSARRLEKPRPTKFFDSRPFVGMAELTVALRTTGDDRGSALHRVLNEELDETLESLKKAKRYLNRKTLSPNKSEALLADTPATHFKFLWETFAAELGFYFDEKDFIR